jgi:iron(III) transport system permease protein
VLIAAGSTVVTLLFMLAGAWIDRRTQAWRRGAR